MSIIIISLALFFILLFLGVPIVVSIGVSCIAIWVQMPQLYPILHICFRQ